MKKALFITLICCHSSIYQAQSCFSFTENQVTSLSDNPNAIFSIDIDGDLDVDVLVASSSDDKIALYENDGNQNFTYKIISSNALYAKSVYAIDLDGDGAVSYTHLTLPTILLV